MTPGRTGSTLAPSVMLVLALLTATAAAQTRGAAPVFERRGTPASMGVNGFSVVLVVGRNDDLDSRLAALRARGLTDKHPEVERLRKETRLESDTVPEAARKALADMKDFLPFKRYQLLDAAWILCCGSENNGVSGRVRGPDGRDYQYILDPGGVVNSKLNLRFTMRETDHVASMVNADKLSDTARLEHARQLYEAIRERDDAQLAFTTAKKRFDVGVVTAPELEGARTRMRRSEERVEDLRRLTGGMVATGGGQAGGRGQVAAGGRGGGASSSTSRTVMDSSFSIALGETVVIGTSRLNGDQALIALLTVAGKPGASRE